MIKKTLKLAIAVLILFLFLLTGHNSYSQNILDDEDVSNASIVSLDNDKLFAIKIRVGSFTPEKRAQIISRRIEKIAKNKSISTNSISIVNSQNYTDIVVDDNAIMTVTQDDATAAGTDRLVLANKYKQEIVTSINEYRKKRSSRYILSGIIFTIFATLILIIIFNLFRFIFKKIIKKLNSWNTVNFISIKIRNFEILPVNKILFILIWLIKVLGIIIELGLVYIYLIFVLSRFPWTEEFAERLFSLLINTLNNTWQTILSYLPNLFFVIIVIVIATYVIKLVKLIFTELGKEKIHIRGFYKEWAEPTSKIVRFLIIAISLAIIFPYLPGSDSAAFKGLSIFIGVLVSFGSTSAITNIIAGIILTYTRAFKIGDRLRIDNTTGDLIEQTLLVTRIRTIKYEIISIPNSIVLSSHIINYSSSVQHPGLILHTRVTIGYSTPWKKVYEVLISAALATNHILKEPSPFVLQVSLDDSFITYEINAYTDQPNIMQDIYSELHQNIQDKFNEAGMEIMSPQFRAIRDGNKIAIPNDYISEAYQPPGFLIKDKDKKQP